MATTILIADDQLLIRAGIRALIDHAGPTFAVAGEAENGADALRQLQQQPVDITLLDIAMPGMDGISLAQALREAAIPTRVMFLSSLEDLPTVRRALACGARGYLLKDFLLAELADALAAVLRDEIFLSPRIAHLLETGEAADLQAADDGGLTLRQREVLQLVAEGNTSKQIARRLGISPKTVEFHRAKLIERLGARDVATMALKAAQMGLVQLDRP